jgi:hypothetical protein
MRQNLAFSIRKPHHTLFGTHFVESALDVWSLRNLDRPEGIATLVTEVYRLEEGGFMLPPFIIDQIRKRESEELTRQDQPHLELPLEPIPQPPSERKEEEGRRGVIIVEL